MVAHMHISQFLVVVLLVLPSTSMQSKPRRSWKSDFFDHLASRHSTFGIPFDYSPLKIQGVNGRKILAPPSKRHVILRDKYSRPSNDSSGINLDQQYLIRTTPDQRRVVCQYITEYSKFVRYLPHDTFLAVLPNHAIPIIEHLEGVFEVYTAPLSIKLSPDLDLGLRSTDSHRRTVAAVGDCVPAYLFALLVTDVDSIVRNELTSRCIDATTNQNLCNMSWPFLGKKILVETDSCRKLKAAEILSGHPSVFWIEERGTMELLNKHTTKIVQNFTGYARSFWDHGILGDGEVRKNLLMMVSFVSLSLSNHRVETVSWQVIGLSDSGIDPVSCFFHDENVSLPVCQGEGYVNASGCVDRRHRKIVTYVCVPSFSAAALSCSLARFFEMKIPALALTQNFRSDTSRQPTSATWAMGTGPT